jgi:hypothetical protein
MDLLSGKGNFSPTRTQHLVTGLIYVTQSKRQNKTSNEPEAWWQRAIEGERLPKGLFKA